MNPLTAVEASIGPVQNWPAYIIMYLAHPYSENILKNVAAFMFGNQIELEEAWKFYTCVNSEKKETIKEGMKKYFNMWSESPNIVQDVYYYNMRTKKFVWVNDNINNEIKDMILPDWNMEPTVMETATNKLINVMRIISLIRAIE
jgi:hypothetical protein